MDKPGLPARLAAHRLLSAIVDACTPMDALTDDAHGHPHYLALDARDRSLVRAILMAALRHRGDIDRIVARFTDRPLPEAAKGLRAILHVAFAQILFLDVPSHSAADLAVDAARADPRSRRFSPLVNALARRAASEREGLLAEIAREPARAPAWFAARLEAVYGRQAALAIEACHRLEAPIDLTLADESARNLAYWAQRLDALVLPTGSLRLRQKADIAGLPGFAEGAFWVQDAAAALPVRLFGQIEGGRALDLCAAPGGKTAQLAARGAHVTALDISTNRLKRLAANLERVGLEATCETANLFDYAPDAPFDLVLLDAPCSSTGTVRRHPDVPWTKSDADIVKLAGLQARMLDRAAEFVAPGGMLVFSNCSLDPREGEDVASGFVAGNREFSLVPIDPAAIGGPDTWATDEGFLRTTPADLPAERLSARAESVDPALCGLDGFFAARMVRNI
ncbi:MULTISPECIES: RsmB/NOP family class I SAM-dependent RNA methyltransferase [unclassified Roseitalea]|uniref:RsmB/NOP family class I SAM-dependent RNA methyltransferase n=1 Tax=unclassified Roseitalea TaxID=2639107 RepID=UPI00273D51F7|nr:MULTISPECIES: RsmB/NOP family class I SAM-dependent RNA methyltransferase [unclassified Roseitalea]